MATLNGKWDLAIPSDLRQTITQWMGAKGEAWIDALPEITGRLARKWRLELGEPFTGGSVSLVLAVSQGDGTPAVLKVPFLDDENRREADALEHYGGVGVVRLYANDPETGAMLLERVTPGTQLNEHPDPDQAVAIACQVLRRLWHPPRSDHRFPLVRDLALDWANRIPAMHRRYGKPFPGRLVEQAATLARELADSLGTPVVVNRDAHLGNILAAEREPWLLIDPKPLVGDRAFDGGYLLLDSLDDAPTPARAANLVAIIAEGLGADPERIQGWGLLRAVENALWALDVHSSPEADLAKAATLAAAM